jgi:hypothetical protein
MVKYETRPLITKLATLRRLEKVICLSTLQLVTFILPFKAMARVFVKF